MHWQAGPLPDILDEHGRLVGGGAPAPVSDTGIGMIPEQLARLFQPFAQAAVCHLLGGEL